MVDTNRPRHDEAQVTAVELIRLFRQRRLAKYDHQRVKGAVYRALAATGDSSFIPLLCNRAISDRHSYASAVAALKTFGPQGLKGLLTTVLGLLDNSQPVPHYVLTRLCRLWLQNELPFSEDVDVLVHHCLSSRSRYCRMAALSLVRRYGLTSFTEKLETQLQSTRQPDERLQVLHILASFAAPSSCKIFTELLRPSYAPAGQLSLTLRERVELASGQFVVKEDVYAFLYFANTGNLNVSDKIVEFIKQGCPNGGELVTLSQALSEIAKRDMSRVARHLASDDEFVRAAALWGLGSCGRAEAADLCVKALLTESSAYVAYAAAGALAKTAADDKAAMLEAVLQAVPPWASDDIRCSE